jgi:four helix bundle protein
VTYKQWEAKVPEDFKGDTLWKVEGYRLARFASELSWFDAEKLEKNQRSRGMVDQFFRAVGSIGANISEGYSRNTGRERARFYEFALGSARESRDWYYHGRPVFAERVWRHRISLHTQIIKLLLKMIPDQRIGNRTLTATPARSKASRNHVIT